MATCTASRPRSSPPARATSCSAIPCGCIASCARPESRRCCRSSKASRMRNICATSMHQRPRTPSARSPDSSISTLGHNPGDRRDNGSHEIDSQISSLGPRTESHFTLQRQLDKRFRSGTQCKFPNQINFVGGSYAPNEEGLVLYGRRGVSVFGGGRVIEASRGPTGFLLYRIG